MFFSITTAWYFRYIYLHAQTSERSAIPGDWNIKMQWTGKWSLHFYTYSYVISFLPLFVPWSQQRVQIVSSKWKLFSCQILSAGVINVHEKIISLRMIEYQLLRGILFVVKWVHLYKSPSHMLIPNAWHHLLSKIFDILAIGGISSYFMTPNIWWTVHLIIFNSNKCSLLLLDITFKVRGSHLVNILMSIMFI